MSDLVTRIRDACAEVARRSRHVTINHEAVPAYAAGLPRAAPAEPDPHPFRDSREELAAFWLTLDAVNFGSGWFPTLRKRPGRSGYDTVAAGIRARFDEHGPWPAEELAQIGASELTQTLDQDPEHELMGLFAGSLRDVGAHVAGEHDSRFAGVVDAACDSAVELAALLGAWRSFADVSSYGGHEVPFFKRAQIAAADLARAGVMRPDDVPRLTMFADNLVPHVLRLDGILRFEPALVARIEREDLIEHGSAEEVEIRACAVHAVELIVAEHRGPCAAEVDQILWNRGRAARYKARPRHRTRCTAY